MVTLLYFTAAAENKLHSFGRCNLKVGSIEPLIAVLTAVVCSCSYCAAALNLQPLYVLRTAGLHGVIVCTVLAYFLTMDRKLQILWLHVLEMM